MKVAKGLSMRLRQTWAEAVELNRQKDVAKAIKRGQQLLVEGPEQESYEFLNEAVQKFPENAEIRLLYASILLAFRLDDVAVEAAKAAELDPNDPVILVRAAHLLLDQGEVEAARSCAIRANELVQPGFVLMSGLIDLIGRIAALDGEDDIAEERLRSAVESEPSHSSFAIHLAKFLALRDRQSEAVAVIDEALKQVKHKDELERLRREIKTGAYGS